MMIQKFDQDKEKWGEDVPPNHLGYFPNALVSRVVNLAELAKDLWAQHVKFDPGDGIWKCGVALRKNGTGRFETWI